MHKFTPSSPPPETTLDLDLWKINTMRWMATTAQSVYFRHTNEYVSRLLPAWRKKFRWILTDFQDCEYYPYLCPCSFPEPSICFHSSNPSKCSANISQKYEGWLTSMGPVIAARMILTLLEFISSLFRERILSSAMKKGSEMLSTYIQQITHNILRDARQ